MATTTTTTTTALASVPPNIRPARPNRPRTTAAAAKRSDYEVVAPLAKNVPLVPEAAPAPPAGAAAGTDPKTPKPVKMRKKFLCETPPALLQDAKGKAEYDRGRQLGEGGFARCFLVQNKEGGLFAAKTVSKKSLANHKMRSKFFGEIQVHKTMIHPNVVRYVECFEDSINIYMILELCPNKTLMDMLRKRKRFTEPEVRYYLVQLLGALKYMHGKRVIHRDLKLGNIFLDENMSIKIGDFGLAALLVDDNERKKTICGTPNYIAPEVLFNSGREGEGHSFEVDLWGVGVIMYAMLCGKPPFQSGDVDSIYKKIRQNTFDWPTNISVSTSAKSLVNSLLNSDPTARPSLDDIAGHNFFKTGYFPREIPESAKTEEPKWPSVGNQNLAMIAASRLEWKKNYEEVARAAGVGLDDAGKPIRSVGDHPGKPLSIVPLPGSRPSSAASSNTENECVDVQKLLEKKRQAQIKKEKAAKDFLLPETLSPRDGHARMRNLNGLRAVPSRLVVSKGGALSAVPREPVKEIIPEESEPDSEKEPEVKPIRALDQKPIRRKSRENSAETEAAPAQPKASLFPARRPATRSYAAQQRDVEVRPAYSRRAAAKEPEKAPSPEPEPVAAPAPRAVRATRTTREPRATRTAPVAESRESVASSRGSTDRPKTHQSPEHIPHGANATSRIGVPISGTSTSDIIASLTPLVHNLNAFITNNVSSLSPTPSSTTRAVRAFRSGQPSTAIFITKWVDYTNKYGVAYILSDGTCGAFFNDNTSLVVDSISGDKLEWITQSLFASSEPPRGTQEVISRRLATTLSTIKDRAKTSRSLNSKLTIWRRTVNYMNSTLGATDIWSTTPEASIREPSFPAPEPENMLWVTHYARLRRCVMFRLVDGTIQCNFVDHTKVILTANGRTIRLINKDQELRVLSLEEAAKGCHSGDKGLEEFGLMTKITYIKELAKTWTRTGRFPSGIDQREGEGNAVVLGEGPAV